METTIHVILDSKALELYISENNPNSHWLIYNGKDSETYKTVDAWAHGKMKKISADLMQTENGILYSISRDAYIHFSFVDINMKKYLELKGNNIPEQIIKVLCYLYGKTDNDADFIPSEWMTPEIRSACINKHLISDGFNIPNETVIHDKRQ